MSGSNSGIGEVAGADRLLQAVAQGDKAAFERLYELVSPRLYAICLKLMRAREPAQDVLQEAFVKIWQKAYQFDPTRGSAAAWMSTVTRRCALDRLSTAASHEKNSPIEELDESLLRIESNVDPADRLGLERCLSLLDERSRRPILLAYFYGLSYDEIAEREGIPVGTVKSRTFRALGQLKECLG